jgi:diacylglycerol kinase family enzyme
VDVDSGLEPVLRAQIERLPAGLRPKLDRSEKIVIIDNPSASGGRYAQHGERAQQIYRILGYDCTRVATTAPGDGVGLARRAAADGATLVMPCSGDGGVREVAMGLMQLPAAERPKFSVLPKGTVNVFARTLRLQVGPIPDVFHACLKQIFWARTTHVDVARLDGAPFVCFAGFGYDATVIENVPAVDKRNFREWAYVTSAFRTLFGWGPQDKRGEAYVPVRMRVRAPDVTGTAVDVEGYFVAVGNVEDYGPGWFPLHPNARVDDGLLDVLVIATQDKLAMLRIAAAVLRRAHVRNPHVRYFQTAGPIVVESLGDPVPTHADCELVGRGQRAEIGVEPAALAVLY